MSFSSAIWELPNSSPFDNDFFRPQEKKQLATAYENFIRNTKSRSIYVDDHLEDDEAAQALLQAKIQLFQLFIRTQPVNIRSFRFVRERKNT